MALAFMCVVAMIGVLHGCGSNMTDAQKAVVADSAFTSELLACVDNATTLEASRACRARVRGAWHLDAGLTTEGGSQ